MLCLTMHYAREQERRLTASLKRKKKKQDCAYLTTTTFYVIVKWYFIHQLFTIFSMPVRQEYSIHMKPVLETLLMWHNICAPCAQVSMLKGKRSRAHGRVSEITAVKELPSPFCNHNNGEQLCGLWWRSIRVKTSSFLIPAEIFWFQPGGGEKKRKQL